MIVWNKALGVEGRFGNWIKQFIIGQQLSERLNAEHRTPKWIGQTIFELDNKSYDQDIPFTKFNEDGSFDETDVVCLNAFWAVPDCMYEVRGKLEGRRMLRWRPEYDPCSVPVLKCCIHSRKTDFWVKDIWPHVDVETQVEEVKRLGFSQKDITVISDEFPRNERYHEELSYLYDFQLLCRCENLFVYPQSSFSGMAAQFNTNTVYHPIGFVNGPSPVTYCKQP